WYSITSCDRDHVRRPMPCRLCRWRACLSLKCRLSSGTPVMKVCCERKDYAKGVLYYPQALSTYTTPPGNAIISESAHLYSVGSHLEYLSQRPPQLGQSIWTHF